MKQISILSGKAHVIELPEGATNPQLLTVHQGSKSFPSLKYDRPDLVRGFIDLPPGNWRIIGMLSEVTEGQAEGLVEWNEVLQYYPDYSMDGLWNGDITALESLESAISAEGYWFDNPHPMPTYEPKTRQAHVAKIEEMALHKETQSRVLDRSRCLLLGREGL